MSIQTPEEGTLAAKSIWGVALCSSILALSACSPSYQRVTVTTLPVGAEVYLQRSGVMQVTAAYSGFYGSIGAPSFEEGYYSLGTTPIDYEFLLDQQEATVAGAGAYGEVKRRYTEGRIRVVREGYRTVERAVRFTGDLLDFEIELEPEFESIDGG